MSTYSAKTTLSDAFKGTFQRKGNLKGIFWLSVLFFLVSFAIGLLTIVFGVVYHFSLPLEVSIFLMSSLGKFLSVSITTLIYTPLAVMICRSVLWQEEWTLSLVTLFRRHLSFLYYRKALLLYFLGFFPYVLFRNAWISYKMTFSHFPDANVLFTLDVLIYLAFAWYVLTYRWQMILPAAALGRKTSFAHSVGLLKGRIILFSLVIFGIYWIRYGLNNLVGMISDIYHLIFYPQPENKVFVNLDQINWPGIWEIQIFKVIEAYISTFIGIYAFIFSAIFIASTYKALTAQKGT